MSKFIALLGFAIAAIASKPGAAEAAASPGPVQTVQIEVQHVIVAVGAPISLRATLKSAGTPLPNAPIHFSIDGAAVGTTATTDGSGFAQTLIAFPSGLAVGQHIIRAEFLGDAGHKPAVFPGDLSVLKSATAIGGEFQTVGTPTGNPTEWREVVSGTLVRTTDQTGIPGRTLSIVLDGQFLDTVTTDAKGSFGFKAAVKKPTGVYTMRLDFAGDSEYSPTGVESPVTVAGPKKKIYYTAPTVIVVGGGKYETGKDVIVTTLFTTGPNGTGTPVSGVNLLICLPVLQDSGFASQYGGCDPATSDSAGLAQKHTTLQVGGPNQARIDLNPDPIRFIDGSHLTTTFSVAKSATKIVGSVPAQMNSPGNYVIDAHAVVIATGKPVKCVPLSLFLQPPGWGWLPQGNTGGGCNGVAFNLQAGFIDGWDPGEWKIKVSLDGNDGYLHSEAIYSVHVNALLVKPPSLPNPAR